MTALVIISKDAMLNTCNAVCIGVLTNHVNECIIEPALIRVLLSALSLHLPTIIKKTTPNNVAKLNKEPRERYVPRIKNTKIGHKRENDLALMPMPKSPKLSLSLILPNIFL